MAFVMYTYSPEQVRCVEVQADIDDEIEVYLRTDGAYILVCHKIDPKQW